MADILTGGRVIFGVGRGYHTREVETFGAPMLDNNANKEFFEEQMEIILKFQRGVLLIKETHTIPAPVPYQVCDLQEITVVPRPIHRPVEIWQPIVSGRTLEYVAKMGIKGVVGLTGEKLLDQLFHQFRDSAASHGRHLELGQDRMAGRTASPGVRKRPSVACVPTMTSATNGLLPSASCAT